MTLFAFPCIFLLAVVSYIAYEHANKVSRFPLPPGPPKWLWAGNYFQLPVIHPWKTYASWAKLYGPLTHLRYFGQTTIILNTGKAATDLLESRSALYSDRPVWVMGALAGRARSAFHIPYDHPRFRSYRKMLHSGLNPRITRTYRPIQEHELTTLLKNLSETPENFISHLRRNAAGMVLKVAYGYEVSAGSDDFIDRIENFFQETEKRLSRPYLVDFFPYLQYLPEWFPFVDFKRIAREHRSMDVESFTYNWAKKLIASGNHNNSFVSHFLQHDGHNAPGEEEEEAIKWCSAALYIGGADTTVSVMTSFFYLMMMYPEVQAHAQAEIEEVIGTDRLPTLDDRACLPFIGALIKEIIRWGPVAPLGLRHRVKEDDVYSGYHIPKGATVIANICYILTHILFRPERHMGSHPETDPYKFVWGFGRRACPGEQFAAIKVYHPNSYLSLIIAGAHLAELSLFLNISNILATFHINKALDARKREVEPQIEWSNATVSHIKPFNCRITPRPISALALLAD
ncbi:cytochrome P450 [Armillaria novae-zelandiae]|uniref:Cytochrome P450 n=1 Tax=Armillaria novae-zelandiae TaxID=153914 RepID=A0AA39UJ63_9AGAR|nr:cytochrome P450 [Armillaria novae-zelandiae]